MRPGRTAPTAPRSPPASATPAPAPFCPVVGGCLRRPNWERRALRRRLRRSARRSRAASRANAGSGADRARQAPCRCARCGSSPATAAAPRRRLPRARQIMSTRVDNCSAVCACDRRKAAAQILEEARDLGFQGRSRRCSVVHSGARKRGSTCALRTRGREGLAGSEPLRMTNATYRCSGLNFPRSRIVRQKAALVKGAGRSQLDAFRLWQKTQALHGCCACSA